MLNKAKCKPYQSESFTFKILCVAQTSIFSVNGVCGIVVEADTAAVALIILVL